mgnify:CR=1 FL=1
MRKFINKSLHRSFLLKPPRLQENIYIFYLFKSKENNKRQQEGEHQGKVPLKEEQESGFCKICTYQVNKRYKNQYKNRKTAMYIGKLYKNVSLGDN